MIFFPKLVSVILNMMLPPTTYHKFFIEMAQLVWLNPLLWMILNAEGISLGRLAPLPLRDRTNPCSAAQC